jgi:hypothetical protein
MRFALSAALGLCASCQVFVGIEDVFPDALEERTLLKASNAGGQDAFGSKVATDGDTLAVAAPQEASSGVGVGAVENDNSAPGAGAVYVFGRDQDRWVQEVYLKASNTDPGDFFGTFIALSGDTLVVGADGEASAVEVGGEADNNQPGAGAAYVFVRNGGTWTQQVYLKAPTPVASDQFGLSVAIDGDTLVVGCPGRDDLGEDAGVAFVYVRNGVFWSLEATLGPSNPDAADGFGFRVAISGDTISVASPSEASATTGVDGDQSDNSVPLAGAVYVFERVGTSWPQQAYIKPVYDDAFGQPDQFGTSLAIDGDTLAVSAPVEDSAATGIGGNTRDNSALDSGAVYLYTRIDGVWEFDSYVKASNTGVGDLFGVSVAVRGDRLAVGAQREASPATGVNGDGTSDLTSGAGAVYLFERDVSGWSQRFYLKASNPGTDDFFGTSVALDESLAVGAPGEERRRSDVDRGQRRRRVRLRVARTPAPEKPPRGSELIEPVDKRPAGGLDQSGLVDRAVFVHGEADPGAGEYDVGGAVRQPGLAVEVDVEIGPVLLEPRLGEADLEGPELGELGEHVGVVPAALIVENLAGAGGDDDGSEEPVRRAGGRELVERRGQHQVARVVSALLGERQDDHREELGAVDGEGPADPGVVDRELKREGPADGERRGRLGRRVGLDRRVGRIDRRVGVAVAVAVAGRLVAASAGDKECEEGCG